MRRIHLPCSNYLLILNENGVKSLNFEETCVPQHTTHGGYLKIAREINTNRSKIYEGASFHEVLFIGAESSVRFYLIGIKSAYVHRSISLPRRGRFQIELACLYY